MSFALTTEQVRCRTKTVTRRTGWGWLNAGTLLQPVVKGQGLRKGETVERIGGPIRVVRVTREQLCNIERYPDDCAREGFPEMTPTEFVAMFCDHNGVRAGDSVTRIEFEYVDEGEVSQ